jgi:hypothetical protein
LVLLLVTAVIAEKVIHLPYQPSEVLAAIFPAIVFISGRLVFKKFVPKVILLMFLIVILTKQ